MVRTGRDTAVDAKRPRLIAFPIGLAALRGACAAFAAMMVPRSARWLIVLGLSLESAACGNVLYAVNSSAAEKRLEEARELGAEEYATYEYYMAAEHLEKAKHEAAEADYGDASRLSSDAERYADKAIELSREAHRGAGR